MLHPFIINWKQIFIIFNELYIILHCLQRILTIFTAKLWVGTPDARSIRDGLIANTFFFGCPSLGDLTQTILLLVESGFKFSLCLSATPALLSNDSSSGSGTGARKSSFAYSFSVTELEEVRLLIFRCLFGKSAGLG